MVSSPEPPNPYATARAQERLNKETAITQQELNMINQTTPYGSLTYNQSGTTEAGNPIWNATQTLSPEQQQLYDLQTQGQTQYGQIANQQLGQVAETLGTPFDFGAEQANKLVDMQRTFLDPQFANQQGALETQLYNQGVMPGTEAYRRAMEGFSTDRQRAYDQNYLTSYQTAADMALTERNQPLREISSLLTGSQPGQPQFTQTPQANVQSPDLMGAVQQNYAAQAGQSNAAMGGLFGTIAPILGGWAMSDRRLKEDIERVGETDGGLTIYKYRFKGSPITQLGVMADELEKVKPEAVREIGGYKVVDYAQVK